MGAGAWRGRGRRPRLRRSRQADGLPGDRRLGLGREAGHRRRRVRAGRLRQHLRAASAKRSRRSPAARGADVIYDPVGGDVFDESVRCIAFDGRLLVVGFTSGRIPSISVNMPLIKGFSVMGVRAGEYGRQFPERGPGERRGGVDARRRRARSSPASTPNSPWTAGAQAFDLLARPAGGRQGGDPPLGLSLRLSLRRLRLQAALAIFDTHCCRPSSVVGRISAPMLLRMTSSAQPACSSRSLATASPGSTGRSRACGRRRR